MVGYTGFPENIANILQRNEAIRFIYKYERLRLRLILKDLSGDWQFVDFELGFEIFFEKREQQKNGTWFWN